MLPRLGVLCCLAPFEAVGLLGEVSSDAWKEVRDGSGECICGPGDLGGGDAGELTRTLGGDLVGDLGGEKATMDEGRGLGMLHGDRIVLPRGVAGPVPLFSSKFDVELRPPFCRAISRDMRPLLRLSSTTVSRSVVAGDGCRGLAGAGGLVALRLLFSKKLRSEDTGFCCWSESFRP